MDNLTNNHFCIKIKNNNIMWCGKEICEQQTINEINHDFILIHKEQINMLHARIDNLNTFIDLLKNNITTLEKDYYKFKSDTNIFIIITLLILLLSTILL